MDRANAVPLQSALYVYCRSHGDACLQPAVIRPFCGSCFVRSNRRSSPGAGPAQPAIQESVLAPELATVGDLLAGMQTTTPHRGMCFVEDSVQPVMFYTRCSSCRSMSIKSENVFLPQIIRSETAECPILGQRPETPLFVQYQPCGHAISVEEVVRYFESARGDGLSGMLALTSEGTYSLSCPLGCADSFVYEPHTYKILGKQGYTLYQQVSLNLANHLVPVCPRCSIAGLPAPSQLSGAITCGNPACRLQICSLCYAPWGGPGRCEHYVVCVLQFSCYFQPNITL